MQMTQDPKEGPPSPRKKSSHPGALAVFVGAAILAIPSSGSAVSTPSPGFYTVTPCRIVDTRNPAGPYGGPALQANSNRTFTISGRCGIPSTAEAVSLNVTITQPSSSGDLRVFPGGSSLPNASAINYGAGRTRANSGIFALGSAGDLTIHCDQAAGSVHMLLDVSGYLETVAGPGGGGGGAVWSKSYGGSGTDMARSVKVDSGGNAIVAGQYQGIVDFGAGAVTSYTNATSGPTVDIFVAKYSASGSPVWSRSIGGNASDSANAVAVDSSSNVVVTGYQASTSADYGGGMLASRGSNDIFVAKYSSTGGYLWAKTVGGTGVDEGTGVATDAAGNVYVTGHFSQAVDFGGGSLTSAGSMDVFLVKYSSTGAHVWSKRIGGSGFDMGGAVGVDSAGNVVVAGNFQGTIDCGGGPLTSAGLGDLFVAKYSPTGQHLWSKRFGGTGDDSVHGVAVDGAGDVFLTGQFKNTINFGVGAPNLTSGGNEDIFLAKLAGATGGHVWSKRFGSLRTDIAYGIALDGGGDVAITGFFAYVTDFGAGNLVAQDNDVFVAKYNSAGTYLSARRYGDPAGSPTPTGQFGNAIAMSGGGNISITGYFVGSLDFGTGGTMNSTPYGGADAFLADVGP
jgi:hypothetical protein